jgi:hypothetical protein
LLKEYPNTHSNVFFTYFNYRGKGRGVVDRGQKDQNGGNPFLAAQIGGRLLSSSQLHSRWTLAMRNDKNVKGRTTASRFNSAIGSQASNNVAERNGFKFIGEWQTVDQRVKIS